MFFQAQGRQWEQNERHKKKKRNKSFFFFWPGSKSEIVLAAGGKATDPQGAVAAVQVVQTRRVNELLVHAS